MGKNEEVVNYLYSVMGYRSKQTVPSLSKKCHQFLPRLIARAEQGVTNAMAQQGLPGSPPDLQAKANATLKCLREQGDRRRLAGSRRYPGWKPSHDMPRCRY